MKKYLLLLLAFYSFSASAFAQSFSYIYLQGDKQTPVYVKLEGEMQPRYGQHFSILSKLAPGVINIEVLFQRNQYLPQKFALHVPENGQRSLLLTRRETGWALYDMQERFYIPSGNTPAQDIYVGKAALAARNNQNAGITENASSQSAGQAVAERIDRILNAGKEATPVKTEKKSDGPAFLPDITLKHDNSNTSSGTVPKSKTAKPSKQETTPPSTSVGIPERTASGTPCTLAMNIDEFSTFYGKVLAQAGLEARLTFLMDSEECPNPDQARIIARSLTEDAPRLRYLSRVVRRAARPRDFASLTNVFESTENRTAFEQLLKGL